MSKYRFLFLPLIVLTLIIFSGVFFALPKFRSVFNLKSELKQEREKLSRLTQKASFLEGLDNQELEKKVALAERALPSKKAVAEIIVALAWASRQAEVSLVDFEFKPGPIDAEKEENLAFQATVQGSISQIESFLNNTEKILPVMKVLGFEIKGEKAKIEIEGYFSPLPGSLGKIDAPLEEIIRPENEAFEIISQLQTFEPSLFPAATGKEDLFSFP